MDHLCNDQDTNRQYYDLVALGHGVQLEGYLAWTIARRLLFVSGQINFDQGDLNLTGPYVGDLLTPSGIRKLEAARVHVAGESVGCAVLFEGGRMSDLTLPGTLYVIELCFSI